MDPNEQPTQTPGPDPYSPVPAASPQPPSAYTAPTASYDPNYLDTIAPPPPRAKFLSGTFGKLFWVLVGLFIIGVSLIIAFSGKDETADLQQIAVRLDNFQQTTKTVHKNLKSQNLKNTNGTYMLWITDNKQKADDLLKQGGVKKTDYNKEMVRSEKKYADDLDSKYEDARLAATLSRIYANSMSAETAKLINMLNTMAKKNKSKLIRDFAKSASSNLQQIHKDFDSFVDDGN